MGTILLFERYRSRRELPCFDVLGLETAPVETTYRHDVERATDLLAQHVESGQYDGIAIALKPSTPGQKLVTVVGGAFRHKLHEAADATLQLHLDIQARASEETGLPHVPAARSQDKRIMLTTIDPRQANPQNTSLHAKWNEAAAIYQQCEKMVRLAFCTQLRATPETTAILLSISQLHIETIANCVWELARQPGRTSSQTKLDLLNAIQHFRTARLHVAAWMPPAGQEEAYFVSNADVLTGAMIDEGIAALSLAQNALEEVAGDLSVQSVGT